MREFHLLSLMSIPLMIFQHCIKCTNNTPQNNVSVGLVQEHKTNGRRLCERDLSSPELNPNKEDSRAIIYQSLEKPL